MDTKKVFNNIKRLRELKGLTREFVADELSMTVSGYSKIERGEVDPGLSRLNQLCKILGVELLQLFDFDASQVIYSKDTVEEKEVEMNADIRNLYSNQQKYIALLEREIERLNLMIEMMRMK